MVRQRARRRAGALDLRDDADAGLAQRGHHVARRRCRRGGRFDLGQADDALRARQRRPGLPRGWSQARLPDSCLSFPSPVTYCHLRRPQPISTTSMKGSDRRAHGPSPTLGVRLAGRRSVGSRPSSSASQIIRSDISGVSGLRHRRRVVARAIERRAPGAAYFVAPSRAESRRAKPTASAGRRRSACTPRPAPRPPRPSSAARFPPASPAECAPDRRRARATSGSAHRLTPR